MTDKSLRVLMLSKACIVGIYQRKLEEIARLGVELLTLVPPSWKDERGETKLERVYTEGYQLEVVPITFNGNFHLHYYPTVAHGFNASARTSSTLTKNLITSLHGRRFIMPAALEPNHSFLAGKISTGRIRRPSIGVNVGC